MELNLDRGPRPGFRPDILSRRSVEPDDVPTVEMPRAPHKAVIDLPPVESAPVTGESPTRMIEPNTEMSLETDTVGTQAEVATTTTRFEAVSQPATLDIEDTDEVVAAMELPNAQTTLEMDWLFSDTQVTPETLRQYALLPEAQKNPEARVVQAESRLTSALARGWEKVRRSLGAQVNEKRIVGSAVLFGMLGTIAMTGLIGNELHKFQENVQTFADQIHGPKVSEKAQ